MMTQDDINEQIVKAATLKANGRPDECVRLCNEILNEHFDCPPAIFLMAESMMEAGKPGLAHTLYMHFLTLKNDVAKAWNNLGACYQAVHKLDEAERCFKHAIKLEPQDYVAMTNLALVYLFQCNPELTIQWCQKSLAVKGDGKKCRMNMGLAQLMLRQWEDGWKNYEASVGYDYDRNERVYRKEDRWDGSKGKIVVAYGEQGIGDEISFASCVPDLIKDCKETVIECDARLKGLFARSFPEAMVYGSRFSDTIDWMDAHVPEGRVAFGSLPKFYRNKNEDFPGTPYLVADPERRVQWRALLDSLSDKPKIGISWQGGRSKTGRDRRSVSLEDLLPVLRQDATFVSLQYSKNAQKDIKAFEETRGIKIHHWPRAAEAIDYDETAALVAELDLVISVTTAVIHLSGALGVPALVLTPKHPMWRYGLSGETMPWYKCVTLIRQKTAQDWLEPIHEVARRARSFILTEHGNHQLHLPDAIARRVA